MSGRMPGSQSELGPDVRCETEREEAPGTVPLLQVEDLQVHVRTPKGVVAATRGIDLQVWAGEALTVLGESGSGKTVTAGAIIGTLPMPPFSIPRGRILFEGRDLLRVSEAERAQVRGERIAIVFQDALSALNPAFTVGWQIGETLRRRRGMSRKEALRRAVELMDRMRIPEARKRVHDYPHEFSGGMQQRVVIAMALGLEPDLLIADEPTTALDVTVQAEILSLLAEIRRDTGMALMMITHDMGVAAQISDRVVVMYGGQILESGSVEQVFEQPANPYTRDLLASVPRPDKRVDVLPAIEGHPPDLLQMPSGCPYHPRCRLAVTDCADLRPPVYEVAPGHHNACVVAERGAADG
jgi:oligopeptide transport system ATP-binding protein